jgi:hypothetical protein
MVKRFPDMGGLSQLPGYNLFEMARKEILDSLGEFYGILANVVDFKEAAFFALQDSTRLVNLSVRAARKKKKRVLLKQVGAVGQPDWNVDVMEAFMRLLASYFRVNLLVSLISDRKIITTVYSRAYVTVNNAEDVNFQRCDPEGACRD